MVNLVAGYLRATIKLPSNSRPAESIHSMVQEMISRYGLTLTVVGCVL